MHGETLKLLVAFYRCTVHADNVKFFLPTNALFIRHIKC